MVAIERAGAPKGTNWQVLLASVALIVSLGALAFTPLNWKIADVQKDVDRNEKLFLEHTKLTLHPVGQEKVAEIMRDTATKNELDKVAAQLRERIIILEQKKP